MLTMCECSRSSSQQRRSKSRRSFRKTGGEPSCIPWQKLEKSTYLANHTLWDLTWVQRVIETQSSDMRVSTNTLNSGHIFDLLHLGLNSGSRHLTFKFVCFLIAFSFCLIKSQIILVISSPSSSATGSWLAARGSTNVITVSKIMR